MIAAATSRASEKLGLSAKPAKARSTGIPRKRKYAGAFLPTVYSRISAPFLLNSPASRSVVRKTVVL